MFGGVQIPVHLKSEAARLERGGPFLFPACQSTYGRMAPGGPLQALPYARLLRMVLAQAVEDKATAAVFGVPAKVDWNWEQAAEAHRQAMGNSAEHPDKEIEAIVSQISPGPHVPQYPDFIRKCSPLLVDGTTMSLPVWFEMGGKFESIVPIPTAIYVNLLWSVDLLRVGIDYVGEVSRCPQRYTELESKQPGTRRFAEVDLNLARDNTMRLEIAGVREETRLLQTASYV